MLVISKLNAQDEATNILYEQYIRQPIVDNLEAQDVNFSFFNNPFALQTFEPSESTGKFSGYIQYAAWWANRQGVSDGEAVELLYGAKPLFDPDCRDINAKGQQDMMIFDTRLRAELFGPKIFGANTFGFAEVDSFGDINLDATLRFRLWHIFFRFSWKDHKLLLGQFWHPFSVVETFPPTISIDTGTPITPNSRNPQIRYTYVRGNKKFLVALMSQQQFANRGPLGQNPIYLMNSRIPMICMRAVHKTQHLFAGAAFLFQQIKPRIESDTGYKVNESVNSLQATLFATLKFDPLEIRQQLSFVQNGNNMNMLSGFAVTSVDPITDMRTYTNTNALSYWIDINMNRKIEPGIYMGIIKNLGARTNIIQCLRNPETDEEISTIYGLGTDIDSVFKCFPRIRFHVIPVDFAFEFEYTRATYGCINNKGKVKNLEPVHHIRAMFASYYYF